jgi:hypothetical protein
VATLDSAYRPRATAQKRELHRPQAGKRRRLSPSPSPSLGNDLLVRISRGVQVAGETLIRIVSLASRGVAAERPHCDGER